MDALLQKHVDRVIGSKSAIPDFVGAARVETRFFDWAKSGRRMSGAEWMSLVEEMRREPVTSVMVVLKRENPQSRQIIDEMLEGIPHGIMIWGEGSFPWPPIRLTD